ncbi:MAG: hypothetical protein P4N59_21410 [Negativicutes bacterium]|nr:hypothetical protein [Negativicutes bacterium]
MSIINMLSSLFSVEPQYTISLEELNKKLSGYQTVLANHGFTATRKELFVTDAPTIGLTASRDNMIFDITMDVTGYENIAMSLERGGYLNMLPISLHNFDDALTIINSMGGMTQKAKKVA